MERAPWVVDADYEQIAIREEPGRTYDHIVPFYLSEQAVTDAGYLCIVPREGAVIVRGVKHISDPLTLDEAIEATKDSRLLSPEEYVGLEANAHEPMVVVTTRPRNESL